MELGLEVERQTLHAGDELKGRIIVPAALNHRGLRITFSGQEVLGAKNLVGAYIFPIVEESRDLGRARVNREAGGLTEHAFSFQVPRHAPPSYSSFDLRCEYALKATMKRGLGRDLTQRLHVTVLPPALEEVEADPHELTIDDQGLVLDAHLERTTVASGETLHGRVLLSRADESTLLPARVTFRVAAIEESTDEHYKHRKVLWVESNELVPTSDLEFPIAAAFEFPVARDAPFSGEWNCFRIHYGFRVGMNFPDGRQVRQSLPIRVYRRYVPATAIGLGIK